MLPAKAGHTLPPRVCKVAIVAADSKPTVSGGGEGFGICVVPPILMVRSRGDSQDWLSYVSIGIVSAGAGLRPVFCKRAAPACNCNGERISAMLRHSYITTTAHTGMSTGVVITGPYDRDAASTYRAATVGSHCMTVYGRAAPATTTRMGCDPDVVDYYGTTIYSHRSNAAGGYSARRISIALSLCCWHPSSH